jgi:lipopolysaccharide export system protein LptA
MRRIRPFLLLAIFIILAGVGGVYYVQRGVEQRRAPVRPKPLPPDTSSAASDWTYTEYAGGLRKFKVSAKSFKEIGSRLYLESVGLELFGEDGTVLKRFKTAKAEFDKDQRTLYSDGEVEITAGEPPNGQASGRLVFIRTSGVTFNGRTGAAVTDRPATFRFDQGEGQAVGASYDPGMQELRLRSEAKVTWRGSRPGSQPMQVEAGEIVYKEWESTILLDPWSRLRRGGLVMEGGHSVVWTEEGAVRRVETVAARGVDRLDNGRQLEYAADQLNIGFSGNHEVEKITGERNARLVSRDASARTTVTGDKLDLAFDTSSGESQLRQAVVTGHGVVESSPSVSGAAGRRETRLLRSEIVVLYMRPGGSEIQSAETQAPGVLEFLPNTPGERRRRLDGERISVAYGSQNRIRSLSAKNTATRTEYPQPVGKPALPPMLTWSKELKAEFDPAASELTGLEQWGDFRYEQGDRKGRAERASLDAKKDFITLQGAARLWDPAGSLSADRILTDQNKGDVTAEGNVVSTREPERAKKPTAVLSESEPFHAKAARMYAPGAKRLIRYEGGVVLWQGGNRIEADWVEIDRDERSLTAKGDVRSQFVEQASRDKKNQSSVLTLVRAPELAYSDKTGSAQYRGGVVMNRGGVEVTASELRAALLVKEGATELDTAYADGQARIRQPAPGRARQGSAEHAEYYAKENKVVLHGGAPRFDDSLKGSTRAERLTWWPDNDRLLVEGRESQPVVTHLRRN